MSKLDLDIFKKQLEDELLRIEQQLEKIAKRNPSNPEDWSSNAPTNPDSADISEMADKFEEFETSLGIETTLEERYNHIKTALKKIETGKYGLCETCGEPIDERRLKANPAATTCLKHANSA